MADPRLELTAQDLTYAAQALRGLARQAESQAKDPGFESCRALFEESAAAYELLARKYDRIAEGVSKRAATNPQIPAVNRKRP